MSDVDKKLISHSGIYLLGNILQRAVSFIMLPIYTRYLTPADYGVLELLSMVIDIVAILLGLRISQAIFRFYHEYDDEHQRHTIITTSMILLGGVNLLGVAVIAVFSKPLSLLVFDQPDMTYLLILFSFTLLFQAMVAIPMTYIRARQKPVLFVAFSIFKLSLQLSLNIYFVVFLQMRAEGVIYSSLIAGIAMSCILTAYTLKITGLSFSLTQAQALTSFSFPLVLTGLISFFITFGDRYFLRYYGNLSEVGIYALAYKFGFLLMFLIVGPFSNHWDSEKYIVMKSPHASKIYQQTFLAYSTIVSFFVVLVSVFVNDLLRIMSDSSFWPASKIVPVVMLAYVFNAWASYTNLGIFAKDRTIEIAYGTFIGALVVGLGYITLIPKFGVMGAAWASVFGFGSRFLWINWRSQKLYNMNLPWEKVFLILTMGIAAYILSTFGPEKLIPSIFFNILVTFSFVISVLFLPILPKDWRYSLILFMFKPWKVFCIQKRDSASPPA